jgi:hypothetical protein
MIPFRVVPGVVGMGGVKKALSLLSMYCDSRRQYVGKPLNGGKNQTRNGIRVKESKSVVKGRRMGFITLAKVPRNSPMLPRSKTTHRRRPRANTNKYEKANEYQERDGIQPTHLQHRLYNRRRGTRQELNKNTICLRSVFGTGGTVHVVVNDEICAGPGLSQPT